MAQLKHFVMKGTEKLGCHLNKSIYGLKQMLEQWYLKFDKTIINFGFKENVEGICIYAKFKNGIFNFLVPYVDDILLASINKNLLSETNFFCPRISKTLWSHLSYKLRFSEIEKTVLVLISSILSQKTYIQNVLKKFTTHACNIRPTLVANHDKLRSNLKP